MTICNNGRSNLWVRLIPTIVWVLKAKSPHWASLRRTVVCDWLLAEEQNSVTVLSPSSLLLPVYLCGGVASSSLAWCPAAHLFLISLISPALSNSSCVLDPSPPPLPCLISFELSLVLLGPNAPLILWQNLLREATLWNAVCSKMYYNIIPFSLHVFEVLFLHSFFFNVRWVLFILQHSLNRLAGLHGECATWLATSGKQQTSRRFVGKGSGSCIQTGFNIKVPQSHVMMSATEKGQIHFSL